MSNPINVVMIGPRGAGKTSILADMLHDVENIIKGLCSRHPELRDDMVKPTLNAISDHDKGDIARGRQQLENLANAGRDTTESIDMLQGKISPTRTFSIRSISFKMGEVENWINFWDFPGGLYSEEYLEENERQGFANISKENISEWEETIRKADVILLTINASTQLGKDPLEKDATYCRRITKLVKESIQCSMTTLVFVPVKCEHLALDPSYNEAIDEIQIPFSRTGCKNLREEVEKLFPGLISHVRNPEVMYNVDAFFAPMITVGGIKCTGRSFNPATFKVEVKFSPVIPALREKTPFHPKNCEKVFALCLLRAYKPLNEEWRRKASLMERARAWWNGKTPFEVFFDALSEAIHFDKMVLSYLVANPGFLNSQGEDGKTLQREVEELWKRFEANNIPEDGCASLNHVYWPTKIK